MKNIDAVAAAFDNRGSGFDGGISTRFVQLHKHRGRRLRFVFEDRVVAFGVADDVSLGEVARALREQVPTRYGKPVSIDCLQSRRSLV
jgi:hypothetical protein